MGDYYWYGCGNERDTKQAAIMYGKAAVKGDPHVRTSNINQSLFK